MRSARHEGRLRSPETPVACGRWLLVLVLSGSCSFTAVTRPPANTKPGDDLSCTSGLAYPLVDMAGTILGGVLAVNLLSAGNNQESESSLRGAGIASGMLALAFASSAAYGAIYVNRCRQERNDAGVGAPERGPLEDRVPPGSQGGACLDGGICDDDFVCDLPMQTCVPDPLYQDEKLNPNEDD